MTTTLQVRPVRQEDFSQWEALWAGYNAFYQRQGPTAVAPEVTLMTWSRFFDSYEPMHALVAERDGILLGLTHFVYHRNTAYIAPVCYLHDLFTLETARGEGVGRALIDGVYAHARQLGSPRVYWHTHESNATARQLYDKLADNSGFVVYRKAM